MFDYIIIGSGIAGLFTALRAANHGRVLLLTKAQLEESNTRYAQGGIAAAIAPGDSPALHYKDTMLAGAGLCDNEAVRILTEEAPERIRALFNYNVPFDRHAGEIALGLEGAHSARRILHAGGDATGWHIEKSLCDALRQQDVTIIEGAFVAEIALDNGRAVGVWAAEQTNMLHFYAGRHIVLASGGAGQLYTYTTNPQIATGDGVALAFRAGAELIDLEFYQFHPTALRLPDMPTFLISEAVRGEGAFLRNNMGERFMPRYDERNELAPRDVVSRAIAAEMQHTGGEVFLDLRHLDADAARAHFPTIAAVCARAGLDIAADLLPVAPAAHYMMGGVRTNSWGQTTVPGLFACGEVACTGVHGANRLASNSLLEGLVFGARIVECSLEQAAWPDMPHDQNFGPELRIEVTPTSKHSPRLPTVQALQQLMWQQVGLERGAAGLDDAATTLGTWHASFNQPRTIAEHELHNQVLLGWLMAQAARARRESRGGHFRRDFPTTEAVWRRRIIISQPAEYAPVSSLSPALCAE